MTPDQEKDNIKQKILQQLKKRFDKKQERNLEELLYQNQLSQNFQEQELDIIEGRFQVPLETLANRDNSSLFEINARLRKLRFQKIKVSLVLSENPKKIQVEHSQQKVIEPNSKPSNFKNKINISKEYRHLKRGHIQTEPQSAQLRGSHHSRIASSQATQFNQLRTSTLNVPMKENDVRLTPLGNIKNSRQKIPPIPINMLRKQQQQYIEQSQGTTAASSEYSSSTIDPYHFQTPKQIYLNSTFDSQNKDMDLRKSNHSKQLSWNGSTLKNSIEDPKDTICYSRLLISDARNVQKEQTMIEVLRQFHCGNPEAVLQDIHEEDDTMVIDDNFNFEELSLLDRPNHFQKFSALLAHQQIKDNKFSIKVIPTMKREIMEQQIERLRELKIQMNHPQLNKDTQKYIKRFQLQTHNDKEDSQMNYVKDLNRPRLPYLKLTRQ